jgi:hypothetical protein
MLKLVTFNSLDMRRHRVLSVLLSIQFLMLLMMATGAIAQVSVSALSPATGPLSGGNVVRMLGSGFTPNTQVWVWANQAASTFVSANEIDIKMPARSTAGPADVAVFNSQTVATRLPGAYMYLNTTSATSPVTTSSSGGNPIGTPLSACADLTASGSYYLTDDVTSSGTCFFIDADNITLNLNGHTVSYATGGGSQPTPGVLLADPWYDGYSIAQSGSRYQHGNFEMFGGDIVESNDGPAKSPAIWVGQSNDILPAPKIHDLTLTTYTTDSSPIYGAASAAGWQIFNNNIYYSSPHTSSRQFFYGVAIYIGDQEQAPGPVPDQIYQNHIYTAPQGGIRDTHKNAKIFSNDITFNSTYTNDFCVDAPADSQQVYGNNCHPSSGRGVHVNANNVVVTGNTISVRELPQNAEYGGCELAGAFGVQVEFDTTFTPSTPTGVVVSNNSIQAVAGACDAIGIRITSMTAEGSARFTNNEVKTYNSGGAGKDYGVSFDDVIEGEGQFQFAGNTFQSQYAYVGVGWDGASAVVTGGQTWIGSPLYVIDDQNGFYTQQDQGPDFPQSIAVEDSVQGALNCGLYAAGPARAGGNSVQCN